MADIGPDPARPTEPDPAEPDPVEPDPVEPDPVEPDPVEPDPAEPDPAVEPAVEEERRYPSTIGGAFYLAILGVVLAALVVASFGDWRLGVQVIAAALTLMAALRLILRQRDAGMLAVRHRLVDAVLLGGTAGALLFLAATIPNQPGTG